MGPKSFHAAQFFLEFKIKYAIFDYGFTRDRQKSAKTSLATTTFRLYLHFLFSNLASNIQIAEKMLGNNKFQLLEDFFQI